MTKFRPTRIFLALAWAVILDACKAKEVKDVKPAEYAKPGNGAPQGAPGGQGTGGPTFSAVIAKGKVVDREIQSPGSILAEENTNLQPEVSGRVTGIYFKEGSIVQKGVLLVKLYDADLKAQRSKLAVQQKIAEASEVRQKELLAINGTSQQEYDLATLNVSNIKADLELNAVALSKTEIRAPYTGKIGLRNISLGAYITPQTIVANIAQISSLKIEFNVLEKYANDLKQGKTVNFKAESSNKIYSARVTAFENTLTNDTRQLKIRAEVMHPDAFLIPGSFISVNFDIGSRLPTIMIPSQSVIPQARDKKVIAYRNGTAIFTTVVTGYRDSSNIEISSGIREGDTILTTGLLSIRPNSKINVSLDSPVK